MAVKKTTKKASPKKASPKKASPKGASKASPKKAAPKKAAPKKKAAPVKLTDKQVELLKKVKGAGTTGYLAPKGEAKGLESLQTKKLIKRGTKDKTSGSYRYSVSKAGEKHLAIPAPAPAPTA
jgi:hypothetical protein